METCDLHKTQDTDLSEYVNESSLDITGEFPDISHFQTKHLFTQFNKNVRLSYLPETLETLSCEHFCNIPYEEDNKRILQNVIGFTDAYKTNVESWEQLFTICPNIEILEFRKRDVPKEACVLKKLKEIYVEDAPSGELQEIPEGCILVVSCCGKKSEKYICKSGEIVRYIPPDSSQVKVFFTDILHTCEGT